jgi:hypothetical protein
MVVDTSSPIVEEYLGWLGRIVKKSTRNEASVTSTRISDAIRTSKGRFDVPCVQDYVRLYSSHHGHSKHDYHGHLNHGHLCLRRRLDHDQGFGHLGLRILDDVRCPELLSSIDIIGHRTCCQSHSRLGQHRQIVYLVPIKMCFIREGKCTHFSTWR